MYNFSFFIAFHIILCYDDPEVMGMQQFRYNSLNLDIEQVREEHPNPRKHLLHAHKYYEICWFKEGRGVYHIEGSEYVLEPGDLVLIRPDEAHYVEVDPTVPFERVLLSFGKNFLNTLDPDKTLQSPFLTPPGTQNLYRCSEYPRLHTYMEAMMDAKNDRGDLLICLVRCLQQLNEAYAQGVRDRHPQETLEMQIIRLLNDNYHLDLSLQELCDRFYLSRAQLCRRFQKATGSSVGKYLALKRLTAAQQLIEQGRKLSDVSSLCGYRDYSVFYRAYVRHFGYSPKENRKK